MREIDYGLYIASSLLNADRVRTLREIFLKYGIGLTYDWTTHCYVDTPSSAAAVAHDEAYGVAKARCLLLVMPARLGSHFEAGMAFGLQIPIVLLDDTGMAKDTVSFHHRPEVLKCNSEEVAVHTVLEILRGVRVPPAHMMETIR